MSESIKKNFAYKSILTISNYLTNFITFPYVSRVLGVERIGLVNFVDNTVNYFLLFATMGIGLLGVREIAAVKNNIEERNKVYINILGINLLFTALTLVIYLFSISLIPKLHQYEELFYIGVAKIIFTAFIVEWFFTGIENFRYITLRTIVIKLIYVLSVFILIKDINDYRLYFILSVGVVVINALINQSFIRKFINYRWEKLHVKKYFKQNIVLGLYALMTSMYLTFNVMYLGLVSDNIEVGYYTTAFKLYSVVLGIFSAFTNVMMPRMSALFAQGEKRRFQEFINQSFSFMSLTCIPIILCSIILAPQIIFILSGEGYEGAILPMRIIMPAVLFVGIAQVLAIQVLMPMKQDKVLLKSSFIGAFVSLLINMLLVPEIRSVGTSIVLLCSEIVVTVYYIAYVLLHKLISVPYQIIVKSLIYSLPCVLVCYLGKQYIENVYINLGCILVFFILYYYKIIYTPFLKKTNV